MHIDELSLRSTQELVHELSKRASSSERHAMILVMGRPQEGDPEMSEGSVTIAGHDPSLISYLLIMLMKRFQVQVSDERTILVPVLNLTGLATDVHEPEAASDYTVVAEDRYATAVEACRPFSTESLHYGVLEKLLTVTDVLIEAYKACEEEGALNWQDIDDAYHLSLEIRSLMNRYGEKENE